MAWKLFLCSSDSVTVLQQLEQEDQGSEIEIKEIPVQARLLQFSLHLGKDLLFYC